MSKLLLTLLVLGIVLVLFADGRLNRKRWGRGRNVQRGVKGETNIAKGRHGIHPRLARRWMIR